MLAKILTALWLIPTVVLGLLFGLLNDQPVAVDLYFSTFPLPLGVALVVALAVGALAGTLLIWIGTVIPLARKTRRLEQQTRRDSQADHG